LITCVVGILAGSCSIVNRRWKSVEKVSTACVARGLAGKNIVPKLVSQLFDGPIGSPVFQVWISLEVVEGFRF